MHKWSSSRNIINIKTNFKLPNYENLDFTINTKWSDMARDYGNGNRTFRDERTDDYLVNDLILNLNFGTHMMFLNVTNLLDEKYETASYKLGRSFNVGIKKGINL